VIVDSAVYRQGRRVPVSCATEDYATLQAAADESHDFVWVGLSDPTQAELDDVAKAFDLHPLAVEDAIQDHQRPKLDRYPTRLFVNVYAVAVEDDLDLRVTELSAFITPPALITIRKAAFDIDRVVDR
jgi:magnesium transporter